MDNTNEQSEEKKNEGTEAQATNENINDGGDITLEEIKKATAELKIANEEKKRLLKEEEKVLARKEALAMLGGGSRAGQIPKKETEEERWAREAKVRYAGTGMDPTG